MIFGREHELRTLTAAYEQMLAGRGSVLFLTGEAGLGKTTLVHEWRDEGRGMRDEDSGMRDEGRGMRDEEKSLIPQPSTLFLESACSIPIGNVDVGRLEALQPWADVIAQAQEKIDQTDRTDRSDHSGKKKLDFKKLIHEAAPAWAWAIPFVGDIAHAALETSRLVKEQRGDFDAPQAAQNQQQVFQQYVNLLTKVAEETPLVIFLDDLHWADTSSCNLLFYLSRQIADKKILAVATYRDDDALQANGGKGHAIIEVKNEILRYETGRELALGYLGKDAIRSLMESRYPGYHPDDRFEKWLRKISDGNALFVTQFLKTLREDEQLDEHGKFLGTYESITIPPTALAVVEQRTRRLDDATRELLTYATAEGEEFTTYILERISERKPKELLRDLRTATQQGLVIEKGTSRVYANQTTGIYGFSHALFHQALYNSLSGAERAMLHSECFAILKAEWDSLSATRQRTTTLATKLLTHAEKCEEWQTVADVALEAAKEFWKSYDEEATIAMCERAAHAAEAGVWEGARSRRAESTRIHGDIDCFRGRYDLALEFYASALAEYRAISDRAGAAGVTGKIGNVSMEKGDYDRALERFSSALSEHRAIGDRAGAAHVTGNIGNVYASKGDYDRALEQYEPTLAEYHAIGDRRGAAVITGNIGTVYQQKGDNERALEHYATALAEHRAIGDRPGAARMTGNIGIVYASKGDYDRALEHYTAALAEHRTIGDRRGAAVVTGNIGNVYMEKGDYDRTLEQFSAALEEARAIGDRRQMAYWHNGLGVAYLEMHNVERAQEHLDATSDLIESIHLGELRPGNTRNRALLAEARGERDMALRLMGEAMEFFRAAGNTKGVEECEKELSRMTAQ